MNSEEGRRDKRQGIGDRGEGPGIWSGILLLIFLTIIIAFFYHAAILSNAGKFMAPEGDYKADVAILEGSDYVSTGLVIRGLNLLSAGKVKRLAIVLHRIATLHRPYGLNTSYADIVRKALQDQGLKETDFIIIETPIKNPVTITEARVALDALSRENVKSAILLSPGFHTRRSYLAYQFAGTPLKIKIFPSACFTEYELDQWWTKYPGIRDFATEAFKLAYYLAGGYIPLKLSY
ncbi:MAG: hypothetical protein ABIJ52_00335 [Pseudomonadota bacterium]